MFNIFIDIMKCTILLLTYVVLFYYVKAQDPTVELQQGRLVGTRIFLPYSVFPIETYYGIPYATAPVGRYRFSAPERHPGWRRTLFAHRLPPPCPQGSMRDHAAYLNEDCLFLNICTPRRAEAKLLPVVILMYSQSWSHKETSSLPCQELSGQGLVVVSVAYRLGLLGFFSLRSRAARGNLALLDQYLALTWIRENIVKFRGNPDMITLLGHSAGADSVLYHLISPRTAGLFHRAILMSPREIWRAVDSDAARDAADVETSSRLAADILGCGNGSDAAVIRCMQSRPIEDIVALYTNKNWTNFLRPVVEDFLPEPEKYLPLDLCRALSLEPSKLMKMEVLLGTTDLEAINYDDVDYKSLMLAEPQEILDNVTYQLVPKMLQLHNITNSPVLPALVEAVLWEYWGPQSSRASAKLNDIVERLGRMSTSARWGAGSALLAARLSRRVSQLYVYRYMQPAHVDLTGEPINYTGAVHGADLMALLGDAMLQQIARRRPTNAEQHNSEYLRQYFANFIKYGSPSRNGEWPLYSVGGGAYLHELHIDRKQSSHGFGREVSFWLHYLPSFNSLLYSTPQNEGLNSNTDETRLRGAIYALVGVAASLLSLLCIGVALMRHQFNHGGGSSLQD